MHNDDMENANQPATKADLERLATKDDLAQFHRGIIKASEQVLSIISDKMDAHHAETSRSMATLTQAVLTLHDMLLAAERRLKPS